MIIDYKNVEARSTDDVEQFEKGIIGDGKPMTGAFLLIPLSIKGWELRIDRKSYEDLVLKYSQEKK